MDLREYFSCCLCCLKAALTFSQSEVENLYAPILRNKDVLRFDIAMHDTFLVRGSETFRDL